ncbi:hypothetical protein [Campylobacter massiliensis]|nr:hypothetical protein [Campylobacter massiliensis]
MGGQEKVNLTLAPCPRKLKFRQKRAVKNGKFNGESEPNLNQI